MDKIDWIMEITNRYLERFGKVLIGIYYLPPLAENWKFTVFINSLLVTLRRMDLMTGCEYEIKVNGVDTKARKPSHLMNEQWIRNIQELGMPVDLSRGPGRGSTDFGNVSQAVPGIHPYIGISENNSVIAGHSAAMTEAAAKPFALQQMHRAAAAMADIGLKVLTDTEFRSALKVEFQK